MSTLAEWCRANPHAAAMEIERLTDGYMAAVTDACDLKARLELAEAVTRLCTECRGSSPLVTSKEHS